MKKIYSTRDYTLTAALLAILFVMAAIPFLGFIPIGPIKATTMHIPVIIGSILLGPRLGAFLGGSFGAISLWNATVNPTVLSFVFSPFIPIIGTNQGSWKALIIVFIPRILIGVIPYFVFHGINKLLKKERSNIALFTAGIVGSLTNTILVMNLIYLLFKNDYAEAIGQAGNTVYNAILAIIFTNGIPEAIVAGMLTTIICIALLKLTSTTG